MIDIKKVKCPVMNRRSAEGARGYGSPVFANYDVFVRFTDTEPGAIICPDYQDNLCSHTKKECSYLSGWQRKK